jgi:acetyl-CoA carboxylase biotin carboxyl carrier protein
MNLDDIKQILDLVEKHDLAEFEIERDGLKVRVRKAGREMSFVTPPSPMLVPGPLAPFAGAPPAPASPAAAPSPASNDDTSVDLAVIKAPLVGTFYQAAEPGAAPFVRVGDTVRKEQVLCIIEAMKLMNEIKSDCDGEIAAIYVENGKPVQFGDRLFAVKIA